MKTKNNIADKGHLFQKKNKVSVWVSNFPYAEIPDDYFEESFSKKNTRATNQWTKNFKMRYFLPEFLETNGSMQDTIKIREAVKACSYSDSFIENLMSKAKKKDLIDVTWVVLLYEYEYSSKVTNIYKDEYLRMLGAFNYDAEEEF